ncbi:MAG: PPC domain-containing protein [Planctomycetota bacterium]
MTPAGHADTLPGRRTTRLLPLVALLALLFLPEAVRGEEPIIRRQLPHIGYVYPAGGRAGTTVTVKVGGQLLRGTKAVHFTGDRIKAKVDYWYPPPRNLDGRQRRLLMKVLKELAERKTTPTTPGGGPSIAERLWPERKKATDGKDGKKRDEKGSKKGDRKRARDEPVVLPRHPLLEHLEEMSVEELREVGVFFLRRRNPLQRKRSIAETVRIQITIDPDAEPGVREFRLETRAGLTDVLRFRVGLLPEAREREPNQPPAPPADPVELPIVFNGQIMPADEDHFRFRATEGQRLVFRTEARSLVPFQADSVPGWMQAVIAVYDARGKEVAYADDFRYDPDPVLLFEVPDDGVYDLVVRDAVARGRDDFVYRVSAGELPFVTRIFPLGGRRGTLTQVAVDGWNLHWDRVPLDTREISVGPRTASWRQGDATTNEVAYEVGDLPEVLEAEPNDKPAQAQAVALGTIVNGRIDEAGDLDVFSFQGRGGSEVVAEVRARILGSPIDSGLKLVDTKGNVIAWNDDYPHRELGVRGVGLQTHDADSYLRARLPRGGVYYIRMADVERHGGPAFAYRLRISTPRPDFRLYLAPSSLSIPTGRAVLVTAYVVRQDGFDDPIEVALQDAPKGFLLGGGLIPEGQNRVRMTLSAPRYPPIDQPFTLSFVGRARIGREDVERPTQPADNVMQAFLWRHLVPAEDMEVVVLGGGGRWVPIVRLADEKPVKVPRGGKARVHFRVEGKASLENVSFVLNDAPKGISVGKAKVSKGGFDLEILAAKTTERTGKIDHLIVEAVAERTTGGPAKGKRKNKGKKRGRKVKKARYSLGYLPAIPYTVIRR